MRKFKNGFTLIEIIITIVIMAILLAVAVPVILNYIDDANDARCITEAKAILTASEKYITIQYDQKRHEQQPYTGYLDAKEKSMIVKNIEGNGELKSLYYEKGVIQNFTYFIRGKYVVFLGYNQKFVINDTIYETLAEAMIKEKYILDAMNDYFRQKPHDTIDSEAGQDGFIGTAYNINRVLENLGINTNNVSWQIQKVASRNGKNRYQFLVADQKLDLGMLGHKITVTKSIYYEDGTPDETINQQGEGNFNERIECTVDRKSVNGLEYAVMRK